MYGPGLYLIFTTGEEVEQIQGFVTCYNNFIKGTEINRNIRVDMRTRFIHICITYWLPNSFNTKFI